MGKNKEFKNVKDWKKFIYERISGAELSCMNPRLDRAAQSYFDGIKDGFQEAIDTFNMIEGKNKE